VKERPGHQPHHSGASGWLGSESEDPGPCPGRNPAEIPLGNEVRQVHRAGIEQE